MEVVEDKEVKNDVLCIKLHSLGNEFYGTAVSQSPRMDLGAMYNKMLMDVQLYAEDGANLMIKKNG
ncbi:DUF3231 family protein [Alkalihalophilus pseudofirmus]|uniref:DUF3231 family protein n=1 Tax=Alkalihalophilus pseudofirmus TaxID=79885 RepID=A0AAJ2NMJ2_ALKPS|nr:DUF3231 family protein [Alkalihalophilus pseudofirmus]MDV2883745.1 DUF3231 family protein [Alkalihalophilus pseudofirmus]